VRISFKGVTKSPESAATGLQIQMRTKQEAYSAREVESESKDMKED
jgi:hypothetical protein